MLASARKGYDMNVCQSIAPCLVAFTALPESSQDFVQIKLDSHAAYEPDTPCLPLAPLSCNVEPLCQHHMSSVDYKTCMHMYAQMTQQLAASLHNKLFQLPATQSDSAYRPAILVKPVTYAHAAQSAMLHDVVSYDHR